MTGPATGCPPDVAPSGGLPFALGAAGFAAFADGGDAGKVTIAFALPRALAVRIVTNLIDALDTGDGDPDVARDHGHVPGR